jgi:hypothetical protein
MRELPETDDGIAQWCKDVFVTKVCVLIFHIIAKKTCLLNFEGMLGNSFS